MYCPNQIVFDLSERKPVQIGSDIWDTKSYPALHTHFVKPSEKRTAQKDERGYFYEVFELFMPESIEQATELLAQHRIVAAPIPASHCHKCGNWMSNHKANGECYRRLV